MTPQENRVNRDRKVTVRFQISEYRELYALFQRSTHREFSGFIRQLLLKKKITVYTRNQSLDILVGELALLREELQALQNALLFGAPNSLSAAWGSGSSGEDYCGAPGSQKIAEKLDRIQATLTQIAALW